MRRGLRIVAVLLGLVFSIGLAAAYEESQIAAAEKQAEDFRAALAKSESEMALPSVNDQQLTQQRSTLEDIRTKSLLQANALAQPIAELNQQITLLGPAPTDGTAEAPAVTEQRNGLNVQLKRVQGAKAQLELISVTAEQLAARASALQRSMFVSRIFETDRSILNPGLWYDMALGFALMGSRLSNLIRTWWAEVSPTAHFGTLLILPFLFGLILMLWTVGRKRMRALLQSATTTSRTPDDLARLWRVVRGLIGGILLLLCITVPIFMTLRAAGLVTPRFERVYWPLMDVIYTTAIYSILAYRVTAPGLPAWRIVDLDEKAARRLPLFAGLTAFVSSLGTALGSLSDTLYIPVGYTVGQSAASAILILLLLSAILLTVRSQEGIPGKQPTRQTYLTWMRVGLPIFWSLVGIGGLALVLGYIAFGSYLAQQLFETVMLIIVLFLLHHLSDSTVDAATDPQSPLGTFVRRTTHLGERAIERLGLVFRTVVDVLLVLAGLPLLFLLWTFTWIDFRSLVNYAFVGFRIGNVTISIGSIVVIIFLLALGVLLTNLVVRWLDRRILSSTRVDKGVQDSIRKGTSYAGYTLAAGFALSAAGMDFSNLAIIFGALGVGIGFGLQSIVNNFISGLILLAERPIRVGDWVALDAGEGIVKRINVRATEIETFDNCSIIVPNLSFITGSVRNWTHGDTMGRFTVAVSAVYGTDAQQVIDIMTDLAKAHPKVLTYPEPIVQLVRFGPLGLDFELKANVSDIFLGAIVASDIRLALLKVFAEKGISIAMQPGLTLAPKGDGKNA